MISFRSLCLAASLLFTVQGLPSGTAQTVRSQAKYPWQLFGSSFGATTESIFQPSTERTFDYIVVGAGNAGIPVAYRLAEAGYTVALIEAGTFPELGNSNFSQTPFYAAAFTIPGPAGNGAYLAPMLDWNLTTTPQLNASVGRLLPQGKALGGSTVRSHQLFHFGTKGSYQTWADAVGDQAYAWDAFSTYLHKPLRFTPPSSARAANSTPKYPARLAQDTAGPLAVTYGAYAWAWASWMQRALSQAGMPERADGSTGGALLGGSHELLTIDAATGTRESAETAYLVKGGGLANPGLVVYPSTTATRILFNGTRAVGVTVDFGGVELTLRTRKEVIVSGGAIKSPQLLMVSGVGPRETLESLEIPVVADLPGVGQDLQDHILTGAISRRVQVETTARMQHPAYAARAMNQYHADPPTGPLTTFATDYLAFEKLPEPLRSQLPQATRDALAKAYTADWPELIYFATSGYTGPMEGMAGSPDGTDWASLVVGLAVNFSRGNLTITSPDIHVQPVVNPGWLSDPRDLQLAVQGFKRVQAILQQNATQAVFVGTDAFPAPADVQTDDQITEIVRLSTSSAYHMSCTCRMGKQGDRMAVVDAQARVFGVQGLRVVDASAFAVLPPGEPAGTVYGLAEKIAADIIAGR